MSPPSSTCTARVTCVAPVNIAVIKYWGKRDEELILPLHDSLSGTLNTGALRASTTVFAGAHIETDTLWLNGIKEELQGNPRLVACLSDIRKKATLQGTASLPLLKWKVHICSENNFPTAAGLASSAAGYACLVSALAKLYGVQGDLTSIARLGSGSACRSLDGGFVRWHAGVAKDGSDSVATQVVPAKHWPEMRILIVVVSDKKKKTSSTNGMRDSVRTSELLQVRTEKCVPERMEKIINAIKTKDFETFAEITMKDSNQFHAICLDTFPPCVYMTETSHAIVDMIHKYNAACGKMNVAYTFDAGPNACLYLLEDQVPYVLSLICEYFPNDSGSNAEFIKGITVDPKSVPVDIKNKMKFDKQKRNLLQYLILTQIGEGPQEVTREEGHLLDEMGTPKFM